MDNVHERAAGIGISKRDAKVAVRVPGKRPGLIYDNGDDVRLRPLRRFLRWSATSSASGDAW